ncbi:putative quinol monooxygenase [Fulvivirga lutimaris]|uniref:putative quinol monooxygenase n=1 Tax=Fulvivirga lutimaris TaxID=1819566 RepID=UPI0012BC5849|nr:antibiotic biosynthesis monooxygenase family protein [Fulvivirga lutimaris]MTI38222.1 antibiotic biosynthesis monooxygenase [Fulvivirga lutimaris]
MLIRIVRMTFQEDKVEDFLKVFEESKEKIRHFPGCSHLELLKDYNHDNIFSTYSYWEDDEALNNYRFSELFKGVWSKTKPLFKEKPVAFSSKKYIEV